MGIVTLGDGVTKKEVSISSKSKNIDIPKEENKIHSLPKIIAPKEPELTKKPKPITPIASMHDYMLKESFDRMGSGFISQQYINVLFSQIGASYFLIGLFHGMKDLVSIIGTIFFNEYLRIRNPKKTTIIYSGILLSISCLLVAISIFTESLYSVGLLLTIFGLVSTFLGQVYAKSYSNDIRKLPLLKNIPQEGIAIIGISLIFASYILDRYPINGELFRIGSLALPGYFLLIGIASLWFLVSTIFLTKLFTEDRFDIKASMWFVIKEHLTKIYQHSHLLFKNKIIMIALIAGTMTGIVQTLGNIYYGLFIYKMFKYIGFGGYINIAMIFILSIFSAMMATTISRMLSKRYGNLPLLTLGTLMIAIQPLTYYAAPNLLSISMATIIGVIGAAIVGLSIGLLVTHGLNSEERNHYYSVFSFLITVPYIILIPLGSYIAQIAGLKYLFLILGLSLVLIVTPMYFILQILIGKNVA